ncbi:hypothetical protein CYMTET_27235 [Cymbomonas tetramitiformis]|uniref:Methylmalonic aciduria and homocystinuria type D protein n=1 Tax=Cymbomonas tetramitiformis TaxID=36881 RepID=A0AAE0FQ72_9CHLO|nr:hypothetical protein CYMTET_27235 [Cymbomonas tetramitiformis]
MSTIVVPITTTSRGMEYSVHDCPRKHKEEVAAIFPGLDVQGMLIVPTCQNSAVDLVKVGEDVENEKDRLLEVFMEWAKAVCDILISKGYWADYIDPCSGLPMITRESRVVYGEVDALQTLLGYKTQNAGCCKVILHPKWGSSVYPSSMFAKAPLEELQAAIKQVG